ncbi:MAG: hypothetical protein ACTHJ3_09960 [Pararhizobium sp.]
MKPNAYSPRCEEIIANAVRPVASELRLIEAGDLISLLRFERHAELADLVASASELYYLPGTVVLGSGGDYHLEWRGEPKIALDLELRPKGLVAYLRLFLQDETGGIEINHIEFDRPVSDPEEVAAVLAECLKNASFLPEARRLSA